MKLGVPRETRRGEARVAVTPETTKKLVELGFDVHVEAGAGEKALYPDDAYKDSGATIVDAPGAWDVDLVVKVAHPTAKELKQLRTGGTIGFILDADESHAVVKRIATEKATLIAFDAVPRTTRAQVMDIRSSMANLAGYRAVIEAASRFGRTMSMQVTAAGSTPPAKVLIIGAGVAGLAALGTARGLGATVTAFDTRSAAREQVESLGGAFLEVQIEESGEGKGGYAKVMSQEFIDAEMALFREQAKDVDIVITTANIPNRAAPKLWMADMVETMKPGSVVVDLAAVRGGNCELTVPGKVVNVHGVTIIGTTDLTQNMADHASRLLARNIFALLKEFGGGKDWNVDLDNEILRGVTVLEQGEVRWPAPPPEPSPAAPVKSEPTKVAPKAPPPKALPPPPEPPSRVWMGVTFLSVLALVALSNFAPPKFLNHLTVFVLSCFIGWQVVWNVTPALHTPLMSVTNAISGIIIVGGIIQLSSGGTFAYTLGFLAILFASINIFGGFAVTHRMLAMFRREVV